MKKKTVTPTKNSRYVVIKVKYEIEEEYRFEFPDGCKEESAVDISIAHAQQGCDEVLATQKRNEVLTKAAVSGSRKIKSATVIRDPVSVGQTIVDTISDKLKNEDESESDEPMTDDIYEEEESRKTTIYKYPDDEIKKLEPWRVTFTTNTIEKV